MEIRKTYTTYDGAKVKVSEVERHRNGVGGDGFYAVRFEFEGDPFIGILNDGASLVYVVNPTDLSQTMRGHDYFGAAVVKAVNAYQRAWHNEMGFEDTPERVTLGRI